MIELNCYFSSTMRLVCVAAALLCANKVGRFFYLINFIYGILCFFGSILLTVFRHKLIIEFIF